jgi:hypothetical protein
MAGALALPIRASTAALAQAHDITATLAGPGISAAVAIYGWNSSHRYFRCVLRIPSRVRTGSPHLHLVIAYESLRTSAVVAPSIGVTANPETIHFR